MQPASNLAAQAVSVKSGSIESLEAAVDGRLNALARHPLFAEIDTIEAVCTFMETPCLRRMGFYVLAESLAAKGNLLLAPVASRW